MSNTELELSATAATAEHADARRATQSPVIEQPERASTTQRVVGRVLTAAAWAAYVWLVAPLLTSLAWALGLRYAWLELSAPLLAGTGTPGLLLPILAGIGAGLLLGWGEFNRWRFTGVERRRATPPVSDAVVAAAINAPLDLPKRMRASFSESPVIVLHMSEDGLPQGFTQTMEPPKPLRRG